MRDGEREKTHGIHVFVVLVHLEVPRQQQSSTPGLPKLPIRVPFASNIDLALMDALLSLQTQRFNSRVVQGERAIAAVATGVCV